MAMQTFKIHLMMLKLLIADIKWVISITSRLSLLQRGSVSLRHFCRIHCVDLWRSDITFTSNVTLPPNRTVSFWSILLNTGLWFTLSENESLKFQTSSTKINKIKIEIRKATTERKEKVKNNHRKLNTTRTKKKKYHQ